MQIFDENSKRICCCNEALKKGIYTKSFSNDSFSIYGNLMQGKSILLNYHGKLIKYIDIPINSKKNVPPNIYMYYCFDNNWQDKKIINMNICHQNSNLSYCAIIDIPNNSNINIAFTNDEEKWDTANNGTYYLKIYPDIEKAILKRYGLDSTPPTLFSDSLPSAGIGFIEKIRIKITNIFSIFKLKNC